MLKNDTLSGLKDIVESIEHRSLPPVNEWQPPVTRAIDMRIDRSGTWYYQGSAIERERMVRLFASVLRMDDDGETYLVTPQERLKIQVDDAPFVAVLVERHGAPQANTLVFTTNVGERVIADAQHRIHVYYAQPDSDPVPYLQVRDRLEALISRPVFYQLADWAEQRGDDWGVESSGVFMPLASVA